MNGIFCLSVCPSVCLSVCLSVCPSVCLSVRLSVTLFWLYPHHLIIMKFSEVTTQLSRFRTVTPAWIHIWRWNDTCSLMLLRRGALLFFKVIRQISRSHGSKNRRIWPRLGVSGPLLQFEFTNGYEMMHDIWIQFEITRPVAAIKSLRFAFFLYI